MFKEKKNQLFDNKSSAKAARSVQTANESLFAKAANNFTTSGNGALKLKSTLNSFVDQFSKLGSYKKPRSFDEISKDCEILWNENKLDAVKFMGFIRTIPRKVQLLTGEVTDEPQKGAELKHESIMRMIWLSQTHPESFWKNIGLFISLGSWHDIFTMLQYDLVYNGWDGRKLNWNKFGDLILSGLSNDKTVNLVKKYLPHVKAKSVCKTVESQANCLIAKWICSLLFGEKNSDSATYKKYRMLKTSGKAHEWQKLISQRKFDKIEFDKIHGRALNKLVRSKFLKNHNLTEKYAAWIGKQPKGSVKYTGFVHELFNGLSWSTPSHEVETINQQFHTLVEKARSEKDDKACNWIVVRDTSSSMCSHATGTKISCFNIGKSLALYFSEFLTGKFSGSWIEFASHATLRNWKGETPVQKWLNDNSEAYGSTNFQGVIDLFCDIKKNQRIPENEFPTGILCISDAEFNPAQTNQTNVQVALDKLRGAGFSDDYVNSFKIVLWNLQNGYYGSGSGEKFETTAKDKNVLYFSGYSASVISFLMTTEIHTPEELFQAAMNQTVLNMFEV